MGGGSSALVALTGMSFDELVERIADRVAAKVTPGAKDTERGFLDLKAVSDYTGLSCTTLNRLLASGDFPAPDYGGGKGGKRGWRVERIHAWQDVRREK